MHAGEGGNHTPVYRENRVLFIVNCLAEHGDSRFQRLYRFIEKAGVGVAGHYLSSHYRALAVLKDHEATSTAFLSHLSNIAADQRTRALDLFLQLHGLDGRVRFFDQWIQLSRLSQNIRHSVSSESLRLVYNTSCYGDSHSNSLLKAGFNVSIGSLKINANAATEYPIFCRLWTGERYRCSREIPVAEVVQRADRQLYRSVQDWLAGRYFDDVNSQKVIRGDGKITINMI